MWWISGVSGIVEKYEQENEITKTQSTHLKENVLLYVFWEDTHLKHLGRYISKTFGKIHI